MASDITDEQTDAEMAEVIHLQTSFAYTWADFSSISKRHLSTSHSHLVFQ